MDRITDTPGDIFEIFHKWRTLCFYRTPVGVLEDVLQTVTARSGVAWQSLQSIDIAFTDAPTPSSCRLYEILWPQMTEGGDFPNLRRLSHEWAPYHLWGMLDNLVMLDVHMYHYSWNEWCQLLQEAKVLEVLYLDAQYIRDDDEPNFPVTLSRLRFLELREGNAMLLKLLSDITAPRLLNLSLWLPYQHVLDGIPLTWKEILQSVSSFVSVSYSTPITIALTMNYTCSCPVRLLYRK